MTPDFKLELQHRSLAIEALLRCSESESFPWTGIETFRDGITLMLGKVGQVRLFGEILSE